MKKTSKSPKSPKTPSLNKDWVDFIVPMLGRRWHEKDIAKALAKYSNGQFEASDEDRTLLHHYIAAAWEAAQALAARDKEHNKALAVAYYESVIRSRSPLISEKEKLVAQTRLDQIYGLDAKYQLPQELTPEEFALRFRMAAQRMDDVTDSPHESEETKGD